MTDFKTAQLLQGLWLDLQHPDVWLQISVLLGCLLAALGMARWWSNRDSVGQLYDAGTRVVFPLSALILIFLAGEVLDGRSHIGLLAVAMPLLAALAVIRICVYVLRQTFAETRWLATSERWIAMLVWLGLAVYLLGWSAPIIGVLERVSIKLGTQVITLWMVIKASFTVLATLITALWVGGVIEGHLMNAQSLDSSVRIVMVRVAKALLALTALLTGLSLVGIDITALSVFTGALGVGLGLGLQKIASNYVAGFIILLDRSIRLGNVVQVGADVSGTVTEITTRYTVIKNQAGVEFIVPNEVLVGNTVQNQSYSDNTIRVVLTIGIAYDTPDIDRVLVLMETVAGCQSRVLADPPPKAAFVQFGESAIMLEIGFWIADPEEGVSSVRSEVALAIWREFTRAGIVVPFPRREIRLVQSFPDKG